MPRGNRSTVLGCLLFTALLALPGGAASGAPTHLPVPSAAPRVGVAPPTPATVLQAAPGVASRVLADLGRFHVPHGVAFLPNLGGRESVRDGAVGPIFTQAPAPVGVATLGVDNGSGTPKPYTIATPSFWGSLNLTNLSVFYLDNGAPDFLGVQLNAVLANVSLFGSPSYTFWTQNVVRYSDRTHLLEFVDNVWNFSDPSLSLSANAFNATGPGGVQVGNEFYYDVGPVLNVSLPMRVDLYLNASRVNISGYPDDAVWFNYSVWGPSGFVRNGSYDRVVFNSQPPTSPSSFLPAPFFEVNGSAPTPTGYLPYDAEMVLSGPGGGSTTSVNALNGTVALRYKVGPGSYVLPVSAANFGSDTGETIEGVAEYYSGTRAVHLGAGPTFYEPLWNGSATSSAGHITITGQVTPAAAFAFVCAAHVFSVARAAWAPVNLSGAFSYALPNAPYDVELLLSGTVPQFFLVYASNSSTWNISAHLAANASAAWSTPWVARSPAQLAARAASGNGSAGNPFLVPAPPVGALSPLFDEINEFGYPVFPGVLLEGTRAHVVFVGVPVVTVPYQGASRNVTRGLGLPANDTGQVEIVDASNVTVWGGGPLAGWFSPYLDGLGEAALELWNGSDDLVGNVSFASQGSSLLLYGGTNNTLWGNRFDLGRPPATAYNASDPAGLGLYESGDLVFNNWFNVTVPALAPSTTIYMETLNGSTAAAFVDRWNRSAAPADEVLSVNGESLTGSIVGGASQGGNYWSNYGGPGNPRARLPYDDGGAIALGGDYLPLYGPAQGGLLPGTVSFTESGLPTGTDWPITLNGVVSHGAASSRNFSATSGWYPFAVGPVTRFSASPASGVVGVDGNVSTVAVQFSPIGPPLYPVTVGILGYPGNVTVTLNGTPATGAGRLAFQEPNGSYAYVVDPVPGYDGPSGGTVRVAGPTFLNLTFRVALGWIAGSLAPAGAALTVDGVPSTTFLGAFNLTELPGGHLLGASAAGYLGTAANLTVEPGITTWWNVSLVPVPSGNTTTYPVIFAETGLPTGTSWSVAVGSTRANASTSSIQIALPTGTFAYTVGAVPDFARVPALGADPGLVTVPVGGTTVPVAFRPLNATLRLSVVPSNATATVNGAWSALPGGQGNFSVPPGNLSVVVAAPGYRSFYRNATVSPNATLWINVSLAPQPAGGGTPVAPTSTPGWVDALLAADVVLIAGGLAVYLAGRRRPPRAPTPPASGAATADPPAGAAAWDETGTR